jgi:glycosyltransferase involved in cell wall biosynthesis
LEIETKNEFTVSVICCSYNLSRFVNETVTSILNQNEESKQVVVSDGGSDDGSIAILESFPELKLLIGPDGGYLGGFWRAFNNSNSKYVTQCCISDGYIDKSWLKVASDFLDAHPFVSLVWGIPRGSDEAGVLRQFPYPQFNYAPQPADEEMYKYWLLTGFHFPEGNFVARRSVVEKCMPSLDEWRNEDLEPFLEFSFRFHEMGYLSVGLPNIANFGRIHADQLTEREVNAGLPLKFQDRYQKQILRELLKSWKHGTKSFYDGNQRSIRESRIPKKFLFGALIHWRIRKIRANRILNRPNGLRVFLWRVSLRIVIYSSSFLLGKEIAPLTRRTRG